MSRGDVGLTSDIEGALEELASVSSPSSESGRVYHSAFNELRGALDAIDAPILVIYGKGVVVDSNPSADNLFPHLDMIPKPTHLMRLFQAKEVETILELVESTSKEGDKVSVTIPEGGGKSKTLDVVCGTHSSGLFNLLTLHDVTHYHRVVRSQAALLEKVSEGVVMFDEEDNCIIANSTFAEQWGFDISELLTLTRPEALARARGFFDERGWENFIDIIQTSEKELDLSPHEFRRVDGRRFIRTWVRLGHANLYFFREVTAERHLQEQLHEKARMLNNILHSINEGVVVVDESGHVISINKPAMDMTGFVQTPELNAGDFAELNDMRRENGESWTREDFPVMKVLDNQESIRGEKVLIGDDDSQIALLLGVSPLYQEGGEIVGAVSVFQDVTEIEALTNELEDKKRKLEELNEQRLTFYSNMSHELRTPLQGIMGYTELLLIEEDNSDRRESLDTIKNAAEHLLSLINDLLDLSKLVAGKMDLEIKRQSVDSVVAQAHLMMNAKALERHLDFKHEVSSPLGEIEVDSRALRQILLNLLSNAIKFTPKRGSVTLVSGVERDIARFEVIDTGIGVSDEDKEKLFLEFVQIRDGGGKVHPGTGLGLALTKRLVDMHHGTLSLQSEVGVGTTFCVEIPVKQPTESI